MGEEEAPEEAGAQAAVFGGIPFIYWGCHPNGASCSLERPALGPPEGALNLGGHDASVKGVLNIFGGLLGLDWIDEGEPMLYAYHRDSDLVSPCSSGKPFAALLSRCASGACPSTPNTWPQSFGSCAMQDYLAALPGAPAHEIWIDECPAPSFPCGYSCHEAAAGKVQQIVQGAAEFWGCTITGQQEPAVRPQLRAFPNPARDWINFKPYPPGYPFEVILYDIMGRVGARIQAPGEAGIDISHFPAGLYLLKWRSGRQEGAQRLLIHE